MSEHLRRRVPILVWALAATFGVVPSVRAQTDVNRELRGLRTSGKVGLSPTGTRRCNGSPLSGTTQSPQRHW